ncbi:acyltransferase [Methylocaldum sp. 14B]|jgi:fucose 4-O-acetylase-like acetyltransferase|uniref:acyltransferase family protein n=1 Tax=Methylocaldum sp. 14B TaxID=1912213 RepID=UPI00098A12D2|nr:acyltransferase [Methylocaldum sp. 14B]
MRYCFVNSPGRNESIDIARGLGMFLVIYGHVLQILFHKRMDGGFSQIAFAQWQAIYSFHMPLFFMISGMIANQFSGKSWKQVADRSIYLILIAYIVDVIGTSFTVIHQGASAISKSKVEDYLIKHIALAESFSTITVWFLVAIAVVRLASYSILRYTGIVRWFIVAILIVSFVFSYEGPNAFHIRAVAPGVVFFMIGRYLALCSISIYIYAALSPVLLAISLWLAHYNGGCTFGWQSSCENPELPGHFAVLMIFGLYGNLPLFFLTATMGSLAVIGLANLLVNTKLSPILGFMGRNSLGLLIINGFYLAFVNPLLRNVIDIDDTIIFYVVLGSLAMLAHIITLLLMKPVLSCIESVAQRIAQFSVGILWLALARFRVDTRHAGTGT